MRAATRERIMIARMISIMALVLVISVGFLVPGGGGTVGSISENGWLFRHSAPLTFEIDR
jgi:hypothetical protein